MAGNPVGSQSAVEVRLEPPSYSRRPPAVLTNPARIDALEGTRLTLVVTNPAGAVQVRFGERQLPVSQRSDGPAIDLTLVESGYCAIESGHRETDREPVRLIAVTVTPDRAPTIRVERPGRDLLLPDAGLSLARRSAADDFGLRRSSCGTRKCRARASSSSSTKERCPGHHARTAAAGKRAASDLRPRPRARRRPRLPRSSRATSGRAIAGSPSSDTFFIEIAGPGQVALAGFELPPDRERYALSQQMIVLKLATPARARAHARPRRARAGSERTSRPSSERSARTSCS